MGNEFTFNVAGNDLIRCDDGNNTDNDGCSAMCDVEAPNGCALGGLGEFQTPAVAGLTAVCGVSPPNWVCQASWYYDAFCDCGCGIEDPDCLLEFGADWADNTNASCEFVAPQCMDEFDPNDPTQCLL